ncbi:MAG: ATP-binding cassette domain-containing protein [Peptococcaceae bacterium]|nr:ATP-binding cassette domain-containing protein [Peptococcaceae bacterium]
MVAVLGANGAGKSTLLGVLAGLYRPQKGEILLRGKPIAGRPPEYLVRRGVSLVPERREIFSTLSVLDNLLLGAYHRFRSRKGEVAADVQRVLDLFPALRGREKDPAGALSGGLQQMLAIGRGLMARPQLLLLDEPAAGMNPQETHDLMNLIKFIRNKFNLTILLIEHDMSLVMGICERIVVLDYGLTIAEGTPEQISKDPKVIKAYLGEEDEIGA